MLAAEGIFDGESVKFSQPVNFKKNQRVIVTLAEDSSKERVRTEEEKEKFREFLDKKLSSSDRTNYNIDAYMRYSRGHATAEDIRSLIREGTLDKESLTDFEKEYFFMEALLKNALAAQKDAQSGQHKGLKVSAGI